MKIIVGVDDSRYSKEAIRHVAAATWPASARFVVQSIYTWPVVVGPEEVEPAVIVQKLVGEREKLARRIAESGAAELRKAGLAAEARVGSGDPRFVLVDTAAHDDADLVVVGTHGRTGVKRLLLGSVASYVVGHAPCSVLVVRQPAGGKRRSSRDRPTRRGRAATSRRAGARSGRVRTPHGSGTAASRADAVRVPA